MRPPVAQAPILKAIETAGKFGITAAEIRKKTGLTRTLVSVTIARLMRKQMAFSYGATTRLRYFNSTTARDQAKALIDAEEERWQAERRAKAAKALIAKEERRLGKKNDGRLMESPYKPAPLADFKGWHRKPEPEPVE